MTGDGTPDAVGYDPASASLVVCSSGQERLVADAPAPEAFVLVDVNGDHVLEIGVGPTSVGAAHLLLYSVADSRLGAITTDEGEHLTLSDGITDEVDRELSHSWGCSDLGASTQLVILESDSASWIRRTYTVASSTATLLHTESRAWTGEADASSLVTPCPTP